MKLGKGRNRKNGRSGIEGEGKKGGRKRKKGRIEDEKNRKRGKRRKREGKKRRKDGDKESKNGGNRKKGRKKHRFPWCRGCNDSLTAPGTSISSTKQSTTKAIPRQPTTCLTSWYARAVGM